MENAIKIFFFCFAFSDCRVIWAKRYIWSGRFRTKTRIRRGIFYRSRFFVFVAYKWTMMFFFLRAETALQWLLWYCRSAWNDRRVRTVGKVCRFPVVFSHLTRGNMCSDVPRKKKFECTVCAKTFSKRNNLNDHVLAKHSNVEKYMCPVCEKSFSYKQSFNRHMNVLHKVAISMYTCSKCGYSSQLKFMLTRHIKSVHLNENLNVTCVFCSHQCSKNNLSMHYIMCHQTEIVSEKLQFDSLDAFNAWKYEVEDQDISRWVVKCVPFNVSEENKYLVFVLYR